MSEIKLTADSGGGTTSLKAPSTTTSNADVVLKLPVADGSSGQVIKTDGSGQLSFTSNAGTTINNNADNRVITGSGTANTLEGEANLTYDGSALTILSSANQADGLLIHNTNNSQAHADAAVMISGGDNASAFLRLENNSQKFEIIKDANHNLLIEDDGTERMRVISSGFLKAKGNSATYQNVSSNYHELVGDTANDVVAKIQHKSTTGYGLQMQLNHGNGSLYAFNLRNFASGSDNCFIRGDGDLENINNSYGGTSDIKLKENIVDAKSQWNDIKSLKVRNFNYKADENKTKFIGLVAQEAETVCPSLVKSQRDLGQNNEDLGTETKVLKYSILYMKAIKALQEAQARIETLETKVAALEAK